MSKPLEANPPHIQHAYQICREIARHQAKNFYYAFRVLPRHKSDAMCAVYAFMRRADDIADDESRLLAERRAEMAAWLAAWRDSRHPGRTPDSSDDPVFVALGDAQRRFNIPDQLLEQLVAGVTMDLDQSGLPEMHVTRHTGQGEEQRTLQVYPDFNALYQYCYLVASVVGLVCIRIFGYDDPAAELLAERTGVAFQLTNILRDVREDADRGRIYLPQDLLSANGVLNGHVLELAEGRPLHPNERLLLATLAAGAHDFYDSARHLLPLIHYDSRAALWVLVEIYERLLRRIDRRGWEVFGERVSLPTAQKLFVLACGGWMSWRQRGTPREAPGSEIDMSHGTPAA